MSYQMQLTPTGANGYAELDLRYRHTPKMTAKPSPHSGPIIVEGKGKILWMAQTEGRIGHSVTFCPVLQDLESTTLSIVTRHTGVSITIRK